MKLVNKVKLYMDDRGYLVNSQDDIVVNLPKLAQEANEIFGMIEIMDFVEANRSKLEVETERVKFTSALGNTKPVIGYTKEVATPVMDEAKKHDEAIAAEFIEVQSTKIIASQLARYTALAEWFAHDDILVNDDRTERYADFLGDILELTEEDVVDVVERWNDRDLTKLRNRVVYV